MNTSINTNNNKNLFTNPAMLLDLALGNGGKANKALRAVAGELVAAVFTGTVSSALVEKARIVETKNTNAELLGAFNALVAVLR